jgi:hypothetical protein
MEPKKTAAQIRSGATDAQILAARFPNMSRSTRELNISPITASETQLAKAPMRETQAPPAAPNTPFVLRLVGQVRGGKNAMGVTKSGRHYAKAPFKKWRAEMVAQIKPQMIRAFGFRHSGGGDCFVTEPTNVRIDYVAGDRKRRDQTGIFDAIFHLLEYAQVVTDDSLLWVVESTRSYSKESPGCTITFLQKETSRTVTRTGGSVVLN